MNHEELLRHAINIAANARKHGNHPFGAVLVDTQGNILAEAENTVMTTRDCTGHAETNLMRKASNAYDRELLATCTLYTSTEPCMMCAGAIYWGNVKRIVFGLRESELLKLTGNNPENPTLNLPTAAAYNYAQVHTIDVIGPLLEEEARAVHLGFWEQFS